MFNFVFWSTQAVFYSSTTFVRTFSTAGNFVLPCQYWFATFDTGGYLLVGDAVTTYATKNSPLILSNCRGSFVNGFLTNVTTSVGIASM